MSRRVACLLLLLLLLLPSSCSTRLDGSSSRGQQGRPVRATTAECSTAVGTGGNKGPLNKFLRLGWTSAAGGRWSSPIREGNRIARSEAILMDALPLSADNTTTGSYPCMCADPSNRTKAAHRIGWTSNRTAVDWHAPRVIISCDLVQVQRSKKSRTNWISYTALRTLKTSNRCA